MDFEQIVAAADRLAGQIVQTPMLHSRTLSAITGAQIFLKFENLQFTASFKERGAGNRLMLLTDQERARGVIAMSAGNHAQGVACNAQRLGIQAVIVMPRFTPWTKIENTRRLGAQVVLSGETLAQARDGMTAIAAERGLTIVHPYDDPAVIAGQGTVGLEMLRQQPQLDAVLMPVGGGGLAAGMSVAIHHQAPSVALYGVQVRAYRAMFDALSAAGPQPAPDAPGDRGGPTIAEGIAVEQPGQLTTPLLRQHLTGLLLVDEADVERALVMLLEIEKTVVEGAGAAGLAAVLAYPDKFRGQRLGLVLSGGNIDTLTLADIAQRSLVRSHRLARLSVSARDMPGSLARIATLVAEQDANIEEVVHQRAFADLPVRYTRLDMVLSTRGPEHLQAVVDALNGAGFSCHVTEG